MRWIFQARSSGRKALAGDGLVVAQHTAGSSNTTNDAKMLGNAADMGLSKENHVNGKVRRRSVHVGATGATGATAFCSGRRVRPRLSRILETRLRQAGPSFYLTRLHSPPPLASDRTRPPVPSHRNVMVTVAGEACFHDASEVSEEAQQPQSQSQEGAWIRTIVCRLVHLVQPTEVGKQATGCAVEFRSRTHRCR